MGTLLMSEKERRRVVVLEKVLENALTTGGASALLGIGYRQARRICARYKASGAAGLVHAGRGCPSNRKKAEELRERLS